MFILLGCHGCLFMEFIRVACSFFFDLERDLPLEDMCFSLSGVTTRGCSVRTCLWASWWVVVKVKLLSKVRKVAKETGIRPSQQQAFVFFEGLLIGPLSHLTCSLGAHSWVFS